jgi:hypothetical protein
MSEDRFDVVELYRVSALDVAAVNNLHADVLIVTRQYTFKKRSRGKRETKQQRKLVDSSTDID